MHRRATMHVIAMVLMLGCLLQAVAKASGPPLPTTVVTLNRGNLAGKRTVRELCTIRGGSSSSSDISSLDWRFFAAGGICAAFSHGITTPIGEAVCITTNSTMQCNARMIVILIRVTVMYRRDQDEDAAVPRVVYPGRVASSQGHRGRTWNRVPAGWAR